MREPVEFSTAVTSINDVTENQNYALSQLAVKEPETAIAATGLPAADDESYMLLQAMLGVGSTGGAPGGFAPLDSGGSSCMVLQDSPMFNPVIGTAEADVRRSIIERDWLDGVVSLPDHLFETGGASADLWILAPHKGRTRRGSVALVDARGVSPELKGAAGVQRTEVVRKAVKEIAHLLRDALELQHDSRVRVQRNEKFGYFELTIDRPLLRIWRLDEATLDNIGRSEEWRELLAQRARGDDVDPLDIFYNLIRDRRHHIGMTWPSEKECARDVRGDMGEHATAKVARILVSAAATTSEFGARSLTHDGDGYESDPSLRTYARVPMTSGYLSMNPLSKRQAQAGAARSFLVVAEAAHKGAWIDDTKTMVGYVIPSAHPNR